MYLTRMPNAQLFIQTIPSPKFPEISRCVATAFGLTAVHRVASAPSGTRSTLPYNTDVASCVKPCSVLGDLPGCMLSYLSTVPPLKRQDTSNELSVCGLAAFRSFSILRVVRSRRRAAQLEGARFQSAHCSLIRHPRPSILKLASIFICTQVSRQYAAEEIEVLT